MILNTPIGTNLRLHDALFTIMSGRLLETRGAIIPALDSMGLTKNDCLRTREAVQSGSWSARGLLKDFQAFVTQQDQWQPLNIAGYNVKAVDTTCIYRPRLKHCTTKHYNSTAGKALPAINFALVTAIGRVQQQKINIPILITRGNEQALNEEKLMRTACEQGSKFLSNTDVLTADRKFPVLVMLEAGIQNVVVRRATNITFRRVLEIEDTSNSRGRGRPRKHGELIRPLERKYKSKIHAASRADEVQTWTDEARHELVARVWRGVVLVEQKDWSSERKALNQSQQWMVVVVKHPDFEIPMVILSNLELTAQETYAVMRGRWGVEQLPLVSKQLLGGSRMFVFEDEMNYRLPELTFLAASLLMVVAGCCEEMPTGWWDRRRNPRRVG